MKNQISCEQHDYFEIVCIRRSYISVTLLNGESVSGQAVDIRLTETKEELLVIATENKKLASGTGKQVEINLTQIKQLKSSGNLVAAHNFEVDFS
ncbi:Rho-binding antiterminator [Catenovulum sp. 2E275]|uniref:Rho-binding antiterminator n=1 Tax=Catenovulum sp. 2E275 TaxID=2980497 RepID=UPI0021CE3C9C|nr:Rho-binding antiterminator [Catenovulum sp. 2E275]MCU4677380.1 Rho-binding antiterminator [Catenovulum sp. 2E275]